MNKNKVKNRAVFVAGIQTVLFTMGGTFIVDMLPSVYAFATCLSVAVLLLVLWFRVGLIFEELDK